MFINLQNTFFSLILINLLFKSWSERYVIIKSSLIVIITSKEMGNRANNPQNNANPNNIEQHQRLSSYVEFQVSDEIIHFVEVNSTRLYFRAYNCNQTVKKLQEQYAKIHQKQMVLESLDVKISPNMPLSQIASSINSRMTLSEILSNMQQNQSKKSNVSEIYNQITRKCNEFHSFQCTIIMHIGPNKQKSLCWRMFQEQSFKTTINRLALHPEIHGKDIQFQDSKGRKFDHELYERSFKDLKFKEPELTAKYSYKDSLIRGNTLILVNGRKEIPISNIADDKNKVDVMSYKKDQEKMTFNEITHLKMNLVKKFYRLIMYRAGQKSQKCVFQSAGSVRILVLSRQQTQVWLPVQKINKNDVIGGIDKQTSEIAPYQVEDTETIILEQPQYFYGFEVLPSHQYIANSIIVHNSNSFTILAYHMKGGQKRVEKVRFYLHEKLSVHFQDRICKVSGYILNNNNTFGDYQLDKIQIIYVYQRQQQIPTMEEFTVSQWKREQVDVSQIIDQSILQKYNNKLEEQYFCIHKENIYPYSKIMKIKEVNQIKIFNVLVANRIYLERANYFLNICPKYQHLEDVLYEKYYKQLQADIKNNEKLKKKENFGIYLYTTSMIYSRLNKYLRSDYIRLTDDEANQQYLPLTSWIAKSVIKESTYSGIVYRGMKNICLEASLGLNSGRQINLNPNDLNNQNVDKVIVLSAFTSTSTSKQAAMSFAHSVLWTLHIQSGKSIQKLSAYPHEKQVLILPFTYFVINKYNCQESLQTAELQEVPMPRTNSNRIIFWVDDNPENNRCYIQQLFNPEEIEVVQITSTRIMKIILSNFIGFFKFLGRKIVIISDMVRKEYGEWNYTAGVDLFLTIYNTFGLSNKAIIFATDKKKAIDNIRQKGVIEGNWVVTNDSRQLFKQVMEEFRKY